jgi:threonine dehydratase
VTVGPKDVTLAARRIAGHVRQTPVIEVTLDGRSIVLKLELLQHTGSFKPRGAFNRILGAESIPPAGIIAASGGNHGLAVAYVARELGLRAEVFVPEVSPRVKVDAIASMGATVQVGGALYHDALVASHARAGETGALEIHAYDHPLTVAGQGTMAAEISRQVPDASEVLIAVGGGGLISGAVAWFEAHTRVVAVEPEGSPAFSRAVEAGRPVDVEIESVASDSLGARSIGPVPWSVLAVHPPIPLLVPDTSIVAAQQWLWANLKLVVEPGGATAFAAVLDGTHTPAETGPTVVVVCGANTDPSTVVS